MKLRCGVVGLGRGKVFVDALAAVDGCDVVAVCDPNPATFQAFSGLETDTQYEAFLDRGLDVVAVISPGPAHAGQSLRALETGAHVLCETPCVYSVDEARQIAETVERTGLRYMLAENYIWQGWCVALERMMDAGTFGEILYAEGDYTHDCRDMMLADEHGTVPWRERGQRPGAKPTWRATHLPPIQYCSHTLGPILHLLGDRVTSAYGLSITGRAAPGLVETDIESALFETNAGAAIRLTNGFSVAHPATFYCNLVGTRGSAKVLRMGVSVAKWCTEEDGRLSGWQDFPEDALERPDGRSDLEAMIEAFIESIRADTAPPIDVYESMDMTVPGIVAHQSGIEGGVKLDVPDLRDGRTRTDRSL